MLRSLHAPRSLSRKNKKNLPTLRHAAQVTIERLEDRRLLTAVLSGTSLKVTGTSGADIFTISDSGSSITVKQGAMIFMIPDSEVTKIFVNATTGGDTINVLSNTKPIAITGGGLDTVNIGNSGSVQDIAAGISVKNTGFHTNLIIDGSADAVSGHSAVTLTSSSISNLAGSAITYTASALSDLTIKTNYDVTVSSTGALGLGGHTLIDNSTVDPTETIVTVGVLKTTGPLSVDSYNLDIGNAGSARSINGAITYVGGFQASLTVDDSADTIGRTVVDSGGKISGISPALINYSGDVRTEVLNGGAGNDSFKLGDGAPDEGTEVNGGGGNDSLFAGNGLFSNNNGPIFFDGGKGSNSVTADDSLDTDGAPIANFTGVDVFHFNQATANFIQTGSANLVFVNAQQASILLGSGNDTVTTDPSFAVPLKIHGGAGNDSLQGGAGNDSLFGDAGNDTLNGEAGNDALNGGQNTDSLQPSTGIDTLDGGDGAPIQIIADNVAKAISGTSQGVTLTGSWPSSTSTAGFYATNYVTDNNSSKGSKSVKFTPTIPVTGDYQVYARWTSGTNRSDSVPFDVLHQGTTSTVFENQQINNGTWVSLGTYALGAGTTSSVTIRNAGTTGFVVADAVRFVPVVATATISGTVFNDANDSGTLNTGETGVHGRNVYIDLNKNGILDSGEPSTTTDSGGYWQFTGLAAGSYRIREQNVAGVLHTDPVGTANFYDVSVTTGATASAIYGKLFGEEVFTASPAPALAINAGGPAFVLNSGITYAADSGFTGGTATSSSFDVAGTDNDPVYYAYRSGTSFSYYLAVPNGNYSLVLNFVEPTKTTVGQRKFNVTVEGTQVLTSFDIFAAAGHKTATTKTFAVAVTGGTLTLSFNSVVDKAILSGFALYPA
jgi:hypothetical protein